MDSYKFAELKKIHFDQIFDIGANIGSFSIHASKIFKNSSIASFEPDKANFALLQENIALNNVIGQIKTINAAVSFSDQATIRLYKGNDFGSLFTYVASDQYQEVVNFNLLNIKKMVKGDALLKMDIEGGEVEVFKTEHIDFLRLFKVIIVEYHHFLKTHSAKEFENFLRSNGFEYQKDDLIYLIKPQIKD